MASATQEPRPAVGSLPANIDQHNEDLAKRAAARLKQRPKLLRCLDPLTAAEYERAKPLYEWKIECSLFRPATTKKRAGTEKYSEQVVAQTEGDAWALFCDKIGEWPSRRDVNPSIVRQNKRSLSNDE